MSDPLRILIVIVAALITINFDSVAWADGKYFRGINVLADPTIPAQRAIVTWRDGRESLIVESTVEGMGDLFGWILPLPSIPDSIEACTPGTLRSMSMLIQPKISGDHDGEEWIKTGLVALGVSIAICFGMILLKRNAPTLTAAFISLLFVLLLIGLLLPALAKARGGGIVSGIDVVSEAQIGSYDVSIISGDSGAEVSRWLREHGFACDQTTESVLKSYAEQGWCFAASKIRHEADGPMTPHPLKASFAAQKPVYPMRLTGLTSSPLQLDLFVIGDEQASIPDLTTWYCDRFDRKAGKDLHDAPKSVFTGREHGSIIGHPGLVKELWDGCVLTHLRGTLPPSQMKCDFAVAWTGYKPLRHRVYSHRAALGLAFCIGMLVIAVAVLPLTLSKLDARPERGGVSLRSASLAGTAVLLLAGAIYASCDVQPISGSHTLWRRNMSWPRDLISVTQSIEDLAPIDDLHNLLRHPDMHWGYAALEGWNIDIPGGYEIAEINGSWRVTGYDRHAVPTCVWVNRQGEFSLDDESPAPHLGSEIEAIRDRK